MGSFIDAAVAVLSRAEQRVDIAAQNISNMVTPGYRRIVSFSDVISGSSTNDNLSSSIDFSPGKQVTTNNPFDLAISGDGFFVVKSATGTFYTRAGQFQRDVDGRLVNTDGFALQSEGGGDLTVDASAQVKVQADGAVLENGQPTAKIAIVTLSDPRVAVYAEGGVLSAPASTVAQVDAPDIRQGAYETSNVSSGSEMVAIMAALRQAEAGQRLVGAYDDLMGQVLQTFGQAGAA